MPKDNKIRGVRVCLVNIEFHDDVHPAKPQNGANGNTANHQDTNGATEIANAILSALSQGPAATGSDTSKECLDPLHCLTERQREIAALISQGHSNKEIAKLLQVSPSTVKNHVHTILDRLQIDRRSKITCLLQSAGQPVAEGP